MNETSFNSSYHFYKYTAIEKEKRRAVNLTSFYVIKDVVDWKDEEIKKAKELVL